MSDYDLPDLPSDDDLGITDEDLEEYAQDFPDDGPAMSEEEMLALLGEVPKPPSSSAASPASTPKPDPKKARKKRQAEKRARKKAKRQEKEAKKAEKAAAAANRAEAAGPSDARPTGPETTGVGAAEAVSGEAGARTAARRQKPRSKWRGPATLAILLAVSWVASSRTGLPRAVPANAPDTAFSSSRAMSTLIEIAIEAHPPGSPEHARVREFLLERLRSLGLEPEVQTTTVLIQDPTTARAATVRNILVRIPGTEPTGAVLMTAHYDGREVSVAAGDDGSGVVSILETVRALQAGERLRNDVIVLITDAEEIGLLGARAFVDEHPWMEDVSLVLSFEMRGSAGPSLMFETNEQNGWVVRALDAFDPYPSANSLAFEVYRRMPNDTDFTPFKEEGKQGLNFAAIGNGHVYHQEYDKPESVSEATLQHHGIHALAATRYFGQADLGSVDAPNVVYFSLPFMGLVVYEQELVTPISGALVLLLIATFLVARRAGARPSRIGVGLVVTLIGAALSFGTTLALVRWLPSFHPEAGSLHGSTYHGEGWYMISLAGIVFTAVTGAHAVARRWLSVTELGLGAVLVPLIAAVGFGFVAPLAAMNLQWPVMAALLSIAVLALLGSRSDGRVGWVTAQLLTVPVLFLLVPVTELVWLALTFDLGAALTVLVALTLYLCLPALEALGHPNRWWAPLIGVVVTGAAVGLGVLGSRPNAERPSPTTLVYAYEHGTGAAVWATDPTADSLDARAVAWAVERAGGSFEGTRDLAGFAYPAGQAPTSPAPVVAAAPPAVVVVRDSIDRATRYVTLHVRSQIGAEYLAFTYDGRGSTRLLTVNGQPIVAPDSLAWADHWGEPEGAVVLDLEMPAEEPIGLHIIEHLLRPEELLGPDAFRRPPDLAPDITRLSDRAMFRYSVGTFVDPRHAIMLPGTRRGYPVPAPTPSTGIPVDSLTSRPDTIPPGADSFRPDSAGVRPDTVLARPDTAVGPTDTVAAPTDTVAATRSGQGAR